MKSLWPTETTRKKLRKLRRDPARFFEDSPLTRHAVQLLSVARERQRQTFVWARRTLRRLGVGPAARDPRIDKIRLAYVVHNLQIGGAQELVKFLALNIDRERFDPVVVSLIDYPGKSDTEPLTDDIRSAGVEVYTMHMNELDSPERTELVRFLQNHEIDVVHSHLYHTDLWTSIIAKEAGVPAIFYSKHETYTNKSEQSRRANARRYNATVDIVFATSDITFRHLHEHEFIPLEKIRTVHNPIDTKVFDPARIDGDLREELGIPASAPVVGNIARFVARKGLDSFLHTCAAVSKRVPEAWFLLVGYGPQEEEYRQLAAELGIDNLIFAGPRRDLTFIFKTMDIFLFTPHSGEAFPMVMLEAMSMKLGVVASNVCSNPELLTEGVTGLLPAPDPYSLTVDSLDAGAMAAAVVRLIEDDELRAELGVNARASVTRRFGIDGIMRQLEQYYIRILEEKAVL